MKKTVLFGAIALFSLSAMAQKKVTTSATISFDASTSLDKLPKADNKTVIASLDTKKGAINFEATVKNFSFSNPMMQEHFNGATWMDSDKYPTAVFKGTITNIASVNFSKDGTYPVEVEGTLNMHGVDQPVKTKATLTVAGKTVTATADFSVKLEDYKVNGPAIGAGKVAKEPRITVAAAFN